MFGLYLTKTQLYLNLLKCKIIGDEMKRNVISGILAFLFLGSLLFAQATADIATRPLPPSGGISEPVPPIPPGLVEARYYKGEAVVHYNDVWIANGRGNDVKATAYVWVERDVSKNLFRGRYALCSKEGAGGICTATTYSSWIKGEERNGVWIIRQSNLEARLGLEQGFVRLNEGRMTITMTLRLQPVRIPEPVPPVPVLE